MASSELLKQIQTGKRLKRAETNDRSAPQIDTSKSSGGSKGSGGSPSSAPLMSGGGFGGGPPQPGGLFAGGIPKLKPAGQSKLGNLGKPPSIPKSDGSQAPIPPGRNVPTPPAPVPARPVPSQKNDISSSAPLPPRRAPPVISSESPPAPLRPRAQSPVIHIRNPVTSPTKPNVATPERVSLPLPKFSHVGAPSPVRTAPPPPGRKPPSAAIAVAHIDSVARTYPPEPDSSSVLPRTISHLPPPRRRLPSASVNDDRLLARRKIPSPPPNSGVHIFPVTGFPPPRDFKNTSKIYKSGSQRGSNFDIGIL